ncbi:MAG: ABC transporter substrate-binding protein [Candidatus Tectomicrobia bacterium]|uniref:ABC transporter substrate-binding protein n=1 Tax=Tectimicrobiota bacterium TaxID=2528274 RepID=A0A932GQ86_UNCTE|nr:ABC transporter substrate-binding protein [Candidatus Tectomicrobia bacterium]
MKPGTLKKVLTVLLTLVSLFLLSSSKSLAATRLASSTQILGTLSWPILVALENGYFSEAGLAVEFTELRRSSVTVQSVVANSTPIAIPAPDAAILAAKQGAKIAIVSVVIKNDASSLVALPKYRSVKDLKGAMIGTGGPGGSTTIAEAILKEEGLAKTDYTMLTVGSTRERYLGLKAGRIDAAILSPTAGFKAMDEGFLKLAGIGEYGKDVYQLVVGVNTDYAAANPNAVTGYVKAMIRANRWLVGNANREKAIDILVKRESMEREIGGRILDYLNKLGSLSQDGEISPEGMKQVMVLMEMAGLISSPFPDYRKFINLKYLEMAQKELGLRN